MLPAYQSIVSASPFFSFRIHFLFGFFFFFGFNLNKKQKAAESKHDKPAKDMQTGSRRNHFNGIIPNSTSQLFKFFCVLRFVY